MQAFSKVIFCILSIIFVGSFNSGCLDESSSKTHNEKDDPTAIVEHDINIPFMVHAGVTHNHCGAELYHLGTENTKGWITDFRVFVHELQVLDEQANAYNVSLTVNDWQSQGVALLSFVDKENCPEDSGESVATNTRIVGKIIGPADAVISAVKFKVGVPFELNHADAAHAEAPLNMPGMFWNWQGGYKHLRIEARMDDIQTGHGFLFHLGSVGCDGEPSSGATTSCARNNRPIFHLHHFIPGVSAVQIDFSGLLVNSDVSITNTCHSGAAQGVCQALFDALGLDFYDAEFNNLEQANEGQSVFSLVLNHD